MKWYLRSLLVGLYAAVTAAAEPSQLDRDAQLILDQPLPESAYSAGVRCLPLSGYRSVEVLDASHLLFWGSRERVWLNQLRTPCRGLTGDKVLHFSTMGSSLCAMDRFQGVERTGSLFSTSLCSLQDFEPVTPQQARQLRDWLAQQQRKAVAPPPTPPAEGTDG
jgi:Family of unknown function (DUF6491)